MECTKWCRMGLLCLPPSMAVLPTALMQGALPFSGIASCQLMMRKCSSLRSVCGATPPGVLHGCDAGAQRSRLWPECSWKAVRMSIVKCSVMKEQASQFAYCRIPSTCISAFHKKCRPGSYKSIACTHFIQYFVAATAWKSWGRCKPTRTA